MGVLPQVAPLAEEQILQKGPEVHLVPVCLVAPRHRLGPVEPDVLLRPLGPGSHAEVLLHGHKQGVVRQPGPVLLPEGVQLRRHLLPAPGKGLPQQGEALGEDGAVVHPLRVVAPVDVGKVRLGQKAVLHQQIQVDEIGVARKGGKALVGAVAVAGGAQGQ